MPLKIKQKAPPPKKLALKKKAATKKSYARAPIDDGNGPRPTKKLSAAKKSGAARRRVDASSLNKPGWGEGIDNECTRGFRPKADSETVIKFLDDRPYVNVLIHWLDERDRPQGRRDFCH